MQQPRSVFAPVLLLLIVALFSCEKQIGDSVDPGEALSGLRASGSSACNSFRYSDTIFYLREQSTDYIVSPQTNQSGTYGAYPGGMAINATNGKINVTKSETGLKYRVWFVKSGSSDTCSRYVTISGINYASKVYRLSQNDTLVRPFYNAVRTRSTPCNDNDDDDDDDNDDDDDDNDNNECEYDDDRDDDDGDGLGDEPPSGYQVSVQGVDINKLLGSINLKKTVANGAFGATPTNGATKSLRIYYRLHDASRRALNYIDITLHFYRKASDVPTALLNQISGKQGATLRRAATETPANRTNSELTRPRPPDIVVCLE